MTYPQIGNYGIDEADAQLSCAPDAPAAPALRAMVVRDMCRTPSNWRSVTSVPAYLERHGIVAIEGVDTRALVRHLRETGAQKGVVSTEFAAAAELRAALDAAPDLVGQNLVETVSCRASFDLDAEALASSRAFSLAPAAPARHHVVVYDCGV